LNASKSPIRTTTPGSPFEHQHNVLVLPLASEVREIVYFDKINPAEKHLMQLGFGEKFSPKQLQNLMEAERTFRIREAETNLHTRLDDILPSSMPFKFMITDISGKPDRLGIGIIDKHKGFTPLGSRGAGIRRILNVMGSLLRLHPSMGPSIILYDEPETSLHADAQHMMRRLLESIGKQPNFQVVYTTHSPAMINTFRPHSIRVLERQRINNKAVSVFINDSFNGNYSDVRSTLGISPADSLLYAPITIVVEGKTEVCGIPLIFNKLVEAKQIEKRKLEILLSQAHFLDGEGSNFEKICKLARSQNATPVVFLDGDKYEEHKRFKDNNPDIDVILIEENKEIEDMIPKEVYIQAIAELLEKDSEITLSKFEEWEANRKYSRPRMFSKKVDDWLYDIGKNELPKHTIFIKAIELVDPEAIKKQPFIELFSAMERVASAL